MSLALYPIDDRTDLGRARKPRSKHAGSKVVRSARQNLKRHSRRNASFIEAELLVQHAAQLRAASIILPAPVILAGFGLSIFTGATVAAAWTLATLGAYLIIVILARRADTGTQESDGFTKAPHIAHALPFLAGHTFAGLCWSALAFLECPGCTAIRFELFHFAALVLAIAMTAMISSTLRFVVLIAFSPLVVGLSLDAFANPDKMSVAMQGVVIGAVPFFAFVAEALRRGAVARIRHQAEKDELISELERSRILSDEARRRAEDANRAKSQFLATMSHELRTPLNAILGFSEVMMNEIFGPLGSPNYKEYLTDIHSSGKHLLGVINEILDLSRVEAGQYALNEEAVDLSRIAADCASTVRLRAEDKRIAIQMHFEEGLPALWGDERALRQIVLNLLSNAVKFTPKSGEIILRVGWTAGGGQYVGVSDNGAGIPQDEIPTVLASFGQGSNAIKNAEQGTGLGLPIVQALVKLHDGQFELSSREGKGTDVIAIFPQSRVLEVMPAFDVV
ncbi:probable two-component sensor histidine kinase protein [Fulvimarina pelagi HTCC2506]|uniref:histidine kinase n=2 Tax=Fulvimarina pelagi TaxID=217511 RepID=Q0FZJ4_9HYPH|nr:probable two-component sensor histidine kinase protein [Fulvimarina pelagi HTCC2506]